MASKLKFKSIQITEDLWMELQEEKLNLKKKGKKVNTFEDVIRERKNKKKSLFDMSVSELAGMDL